jgi:hypothetical protein
MCCDQVTVVLLSARPKPLQSAHGQNGAANGSRDHLRVLMESRSAHNLSMGGGWALQQDTRPAPSELLEGLLQHQQQRKSAGNTLLNVRHVCF